MKNSILGFSQAKIIEFNKNSENKVDLTDLLIIEYIASSMYMSDMEYILCEGEVYVWISHEKFLSELPIIDIKENMLRKRLHKLSELGLIQSNKKSDCDARGSKTYYTITDVTRYLYLDTTTCKKLPNSTRPPVKNYTSDNNIYNIYNNTTDSSIISNNSNINITTKPQKSKNLYQSCLDIIYEFTEDSNVRELLIQYLNLLLEIYRMSGKQLYKNVFRGKINTLKKIAEENNYSTKQIEEVILTAANCGWQNFYPLKQYTSKSDNVRWEKDKTEKGDIIYEKY